MLNPQWPYMCREPLPLHADRDACQDITSRLLVWTAADEKTLRNTVQAYEKYLQTPSLNTRQRLDLDKMAFTLASRRSHLLWRTFAVVDEAAVSDYGTEAAQLLTTVPTRALTNLNLVFVFTGQGAQYASMGMSLVQYPVFRDTLKQIETVMQSLGSGWSIFGEHTYLLPSSPGYMIIYIYIL